MKILKTNKGKYAVCNNENKAIAIFKTEKESKDYIEKRDSFRTLEELLAAFDCGLAETVSEIAAACEDELGYEFQYWYETLPIFQHHFPEAMKVEGSNGELKKICFGANDGQGELVFTYGSFSVNAWRY